VGIIGALAGAGRAPAQELPGNLVGMYIHQHWPYLVSGRKLAFSEAARDVQGGGGEGARLILAAATPKPSKFFGASDTAPVGLGLQLQVGRLQAASRTGLACTHPRASNSRPITCRL
jgi:hypothetical protein